MLKRTHNMSTAIFAMAVVLLGTGMIGCVTPRRMDTLEEEVKVTQRQNAETQKLIRGIDSTLIGESEENRRLRADMSVTIDQLQLQIQQLQENYSDLLQRIDQIYESLDNRGRLQGSRGAVPTPPVGTDTKPQAPPTVAADDPECSQMYDDAFVLVRRTEYERAIDIFNNFLAKCPNHELAENAYYWVGESFYSLGKYPEAIERLDYLINNFKASPNSSRALFKLGRCKEELGNKKEAKQIFQRLVDNHPGTLEAEQAKERLKSL